MNPSSGAGDAFNAAFIYGWLKDWALIEADMLANAVGANKVSKLGSGRRVPTRSEVSQFLSRKGINLRLD